MNHPRNLWLFIRLLLFDPIEFFDRAEVVLQARLETLRGSWRTTAYQRKVRFEDCVQAMSPILGRDLSKILYEAELANVQRHVAGMTTQLEKRSSLPFPTIYNVDSTLVRLIYLLCRVLEPETVVETGVAYGVSSAAILAALHKNQRGILHSIDLPPLGTRASDVPIGVMVPREYRDRWRLHVGPSKRILPSLLAGNIDKVDVFLHDSVQVYAVQRMELKTVWPRMSTRSAIIADSIHRNTAFARFVDEQHVHSWFAVEEEGEKQGHLAGVILNV